MTGDRLVLGIDGGGSKTAVLLASPDALATDWPLGWRILGAGRSGPSNLRAVGIDRATASLSQGIDAAFAAAGLNRQPVSAACFGLAGVGRDSDRSAIETWAKNSAVAERCAVLTDAETIVRGGTESWGIVLICGTGSMAFGVASDGKSARAGGWGHLFGDEGSGYQIAVESLRAAAKAADGRGPATWLTEKLSRQLQIQCPQQLIERVYAADFDKSKVALLADLAFEAAVLGDPVANAILSAAAKELTDAVCAVHRSLAFEFDRPFPLSLTGGVVVCRSQFSEMIQTNLTALGLQPKPVSIVTEPAARALAVATRI